MQLTKSHLLVLRACYAHGEDGDWDMDAVKRQLVLGDGLTEAEAQGAIDGAEREGVITITEAPSAVVLPFRGRS